MSSEYVQKPKRETPLKFFRKLPSCFASYFRNDAKRILYNIEAQRLQI